MPSLYTTPARFDGVQITDLLRVLIADALKRAHLAFAAAAIRLRPAGEITRLRPVLPLLFRASDRACPSSDNRRALWAARILARAAARTMRFGTTSEREREKLSL